MKNWNGGKLAPMVCALLGATIGLGAVADAQAPSLSRDYEVAPATTNWLQPQVIGEFRFAARPDQAGCREGFFFLVEQTSRRQIDWERDRAFDAAMVEIGNRVERECPGVQLVRMKYGPGFKSVRKRDGWHLMRIAAEIKRQKEEEQRIFYNEPLFPAGGANPLADRGFYASRLVASDDRLSLYEAFNTEYDYGQNGRGLRMVVVHHAGPTDPIVTLRKSEVTGAFTFQDDLMTRLNALLAAGANPNAFNYKGAGMAHYVTSFHAPGAASANGTNQIEPPFFSSGYVLGKPAANDAPQIESVSGYPRLASCQCTGPRQQVWSQAQRKFNYLDSPISVADLFPEAAQ